MEKECCKDIEGEYCKFGTRHLSSFVSFFDTAAEMLISSNSNVFLALGKITADSLKHNVGFWISWVYLALLLIFGCIGHREDSKQLKGDLLLENLFKSTRKE